MVEEKKDMPSFTSVEEAQAYYLKNGFTIVDNVDKSPSNEITMQRYSEESIQRISISLKNDKVESIEEIIPLSSVDEYIEYFQAFDYKLTNDTDTNGIRNATLRMYSADDYGEIKIKSIDGKIFVTKMINGKVIP